MIAFVLSRIGYFISDLVSEFAVFSFSNVLSTVCISRFCSILAVSVCLNRSHFPTSMEELLHRQWIQGSQFLMEQGQMLDSMSSKSQEYFLSFVDS